MTLFAPRISSPRSDEGERALRFPRAILEILFGSLLGDGHAEYRSKGKGTRFTFYQEGSHVSYLLWLHDLLSESGYCSNRLPEIQTRLSVKGKVRKIIRFRT